MKLMYLTDQLYLHGGIEKMTSQKINHWIADFGYEVILCTSQHGNKPFVYDLNSNCKHVDLGVNYNRSQSYFHPKNFAKSIGHFKSLRNLIKKEKPDAIISVNYTPEQFFLPFLEKRIPKLKEFHSSGVNINFSGGIGAKLKQRLFFILGKYDAQIVLNEDEKKYYPFKNVVVIPNFVEDDSAKVETAVREKTIIAAGRIAAVKQFDHIIKAWAMIANDFPDWNVKIFGGGDPLLSERLQNYIQENSIVNVQLCGETSQLDAELQQASIYAMTSSTECFPMVLLEALNAGLPIVSYDCPNGPRNIITDGVDGLLTPHNEIPIFAETLAKLIRDEALRMEMQWAGPKNAARFSAQKVMQQWNALLMNMTGNV